MNTWAKLVPLCSKVHSLLYVHRNRDAARANLPRLKSLFEKLPETDVSIIGAEAHALFHELSGHLTMAISFRQRELERMQKLYIDIATHKYDRETQRALLAGRGKRVFNGRKKILARLLRESPSLMMGK